MHLLRRAAFVTGGAQGLGKAFTEALLARGARVCLADIQNVKGKEVETELQKKYGKDNVMFVHCDVASEDNLSDSFKSAVSKFGQIDLMVNNAGIGDESKFTQMMSINLAGAIHGSHLAIEHMRKDKGGQGGVIVNVASTAGLVGVYCVPLYCAVKFGLVGFHESWSGNPHNDEMGLQFACLCPAFTDTAIMDFNENKMLYYDEGVQLIEYIGVNTVESVTEGFLKLVESENCNGDVITVTAKDGIQYHKKGNVKVKHSRL